MNVCMYVCMYVYVCLCTYVCVCVCMYVCMCVCVCTYICMLVCMYVYMYVCVFIKHAPLLGVILHATIYVLVSFAGNAVTSITAPVIAFPLHF